MPNGVQERIRENLAVLELSPGAGWDDIRAAHRTLSAVWCPDRFPDAPELALRAEAKIASLNDALASLEHLYSGRDVRPVDRSQAWLRKLCAASGVALLTAAAALPALDAFLTSGHPIEITWRQLPPASRHASLPADPWVAGIIDSARRCDAGATRHLARSGEDLDTRDPFGDTALIWATKQNCAPVVEILLNSGADSSLASLNGFTPLMWARWYDLAALELLLARFERRPA